MSHFMLVRVKRTDGGTEAMRLDVDEFLSVLRQDLTGRSVMKDSDVFLYKGNAVYRGDEATIVVKDILDGDQLGLGDAGQLPPPGVGDGYDQYLQLTNDQKLSILNNVQIYRGLTFDENNWTAAYDAFTFKSGYLPAPTSPADSVKTEDYCFSEVVKQFKTNTSAFAKLEISTPFVSAEAEYRWEKSQQTSSRDVTEYLITRQQVNKIQLTMSADGLLPTRPFLNEVNAAVRGGVTITSYANLVGVLNKYGYYTAQEFMLGGIIMASESTTIKEFGQAESEKREFNVAFSAKYKMFGGGAGGGGSDGSDSSIDQNNKYRNMMLKVIGGLPGSSDYDDWAKSLNKANTWRITDVTAFRPSLALLIHQDDATLTTAMSVIEDFHEVSTVAKMTPPQLNMTAYLRRLQAMTQIDWGGGR